MRDDFREAFARGALDEVCRRFLSPRGFVLDYTGLDGEVELPTPEDHRLRRPNGLAWYSPTENGAFFTGLLLAGVVGWWGRTGDPALERRAVELANALILLGSVGERSGFVARSVSAVDDSHPVAGSDDQTLPLLYGLWIMLRSGMGDEPLRSAAHHLLVAICTELRETGWSMPTDGGPGFGYRGSFAHSSYIHSARLLFAHRIMMELAPDPGPWSILYRERLFERGEDGRRRIDLLAEGARYSHLGSWPGYPENPHFWISASSQACLRALHDLEDDPEVRAAFALGLGANANAALPHVVAAGLLDPDDRSAFTVDWRLLESLWEPQATIEDALRVGSAQGARWVELNPRKFVEDTFVREPLFAAWVASLGTETTVRDAAWEQLEAAAPRLDWTRMHTASFFAAILIEP